MDNEIINNNEPAPEEKPDTTGKTESVDAPRPDGAKRRQRNRQRKKNAPEKTPDTAENTENEPQAKQKDKPERRDRKPKTQPVGDDMTAPDPQTQEQIPEPEPETTYEVIGVRFKQNGKVYYFDPAGMTFRRDDHVMVDTSRGIEYGFVSMGNRNVPAREVVLPLRKAIRAATDDDEQRYEANLEKETEAYNLCLSKIEEHRLDMKLVDVEYTFDNSKLLFYFTAEGRVDFRELVKDLASVFRTRIELRQIGIRDEAKLMGGLGVCGRPFCCASFLPDFVQVSIKMAKEQNLSLNSAKISGACGRLMCCLRYEYDTYAEEIAKTPKVDSIVDTPDGEGIVVETSPLAGLCKVSLTKNPSSIQLYNRNDLKVKGSAKGKKNQQPQPQPKDGGKKS